MNRNIVAAFALGSPTFAVVLGKRVRAGARARALTARIAAVKKRLLYGGVMREVEWRRKTGPIDVRGRQGVSTTLIDALIEQRPGLERDRIATERVDDTVLTILDQLAIIDSDTFRWGEHTYSVKAIDGLLQDEETGTRFFSTVTVIR